MCRLQKWTFNIDAASFYSGYCPFFWMTWLAILSSPLILVWKLIQKVLDPIRLRVQRFIKDYDHKKCIRLKALRDTPLRPTDEHLVEINNMRQHYDNDFDALCRWWTHSDCSSMTHSRYLLWMKENPNWVALAVEAIERVRLLKEARRAREARTRKLVANVSLIGRGISKALMIALVGLAFYGLYLLAFLVAANFDAVWNVSVAIVQMIGGGLLALGILFLFFVLIQELREKLPSKPPKISSEPPMIVRIFTPVAKVFSFLFETIKMTYKAECPMIIWGEENGKISKRKKS